MFSCLDAAHMNLWGGQTLPHYERQSENYLSMYHMNHLYCASNYSVCSTKTMSGVLDCLLDKMEEYTNGMESLVEEMTEDYLTEKRRTESLLYELLPK